MNESITKNLFLATRDRAAEVALRKELQEKERQQKLEVKRKEQEERLKRIGEHKNQLILQRAREKAERELQKSKAVIDRRLAHLEQEKVRKEEILQKAHSATSRTAQNSQKKVFAFGSSTPRELSYLEKLSKDQKQYDRRLAPASTPSSNASPSITPPRDTHSTRNSSVTRGPKLMLGNNMTSSLYVPQQAKPAAPRVSPPKRSSPAKIFPATKANPMTQSLFVSKKLSTPPQSNKSTPKARNISPAKLLANKRSPVTSISQSPNQRKPPIPRASTGTPTRAPPKAQVIEKKESPKPKAIIPRKVVQPQPPPTSSEKENASIEAPIIVTEQHEAEAPKEDEGHISPPSTPAVGPISNEEHKVEPQEIVEAVEKQFYVPPNDEEYSDEHFVDNETYRVDDNEQLKVIANPSEPKSLQDELMEANTVADSGASENQIITDNVPSHDNAPNEIVGESEAKQPLLQTENESIEDHHKNDEAEVAHEKHPEFGAKEQKGHDTTDNGHNVSYSIDDAISGLANLQLNTPQKDSNIVIEQNFIDFGGETPVAESQPPQFIQDPTKIDSLDLSALKKDDGFSGSEEKLMDSNQQGSGNETSRVESPDQGPFSSSSSAKESDAENADIIRMSDDKKEKPPERKARLSEILAKARQGMSISPPTNATPTNNATSNSENGSQSAVDAKLLALKLIEQRRQEKMATGIENDTTLSSDNISESEPTITANNNTNGNGPRLSLAEELAVANNQQIKPMDILPGQPIYDSDYKIMNGKTTPPEDPSHVQLV